MQDTSFPHRLPYVSSALLLEKLGGGDLEPYPLPLTEACFSGALANMRAGLSAEREDRVTAPHIQPENFDLVGKQCEKKFYFYLLPQ